MTLQDLDDVIREFLPRIQNISERKTCSNDEHTQSELIESDEDMIYRLD